MPSPLSSPDQLQQTSSSEVGGVSEARRRCLGARVGGASVAVTGGGEEPIVVSVVVVQVEGEVSATKTQVSTR